VDKGAPITIGFSAEFDREGKKKKTKNRTMEK
jgi:hypothetical protein